MKADEVSDLFARLGRLTNALSKKAGNGMEWTYTFSDGSTHTYKVSNLRSHKLVEDDISNLLIWLWSAKDYLKSLAKRVGLNPEIVEQAINSDPYLQICGDLANTLKHAELRKSRSGKYPQLGKLSFTAPQQSIGSLTFNAFEVEMVLDKPELVHFSMPVLSSDGEEIGDVFEITSASLKAMERIREQIEHTA